MKIPKCKKCGHSKRFHYLYYPNKNSKLMDCSKCRDWCNFEMEELK